MPWETDDSSGFLTKFRGKVTESYLETDPNYNKGETLLLFWEVEVLEVLDDAYDGEVPETVNINFPLGNGWDTEDGRVAEHPKRQKFHSASIYGKLIDGIIGKVENYGTNATRTDGEELVIELTDARDVLETRGEPNDANIWLETIWDFGEVQYDYGVNKKNKEQMVSTRTMPIGFVGVEGEEKKTSKAAKKTTKAKTATKAAAKTKAEDPKAAQKRKIEERAAARRARLTKEAEGEGGNPFSAMTDDGELADKLLEILNGSDDYGVYSDAVLNIDEVVTDEDLLMAVLDTDDGPWAVKEAAEAAEAN